METGAGEGGEANVENVEGDVNVGGGEAAQPESQPAEGGDQGGSEE